MSYVSACPLVVDLDGTLLDSDLLVEAAVAHVRMNPFGALSPVGWLLFGGKAGLKERMALSVDIDVESLPYNPRVLALIKEERARGRQIVLATASHVDYAKRVATHLDVFDRVIGTEGGVNLSAHRKAERLVGDYGNGGFDYMGNSHADLPVWQHARRAYVVNASESVQKSAEVYGNVHEVIRTRPSRFRMWAKAMRLHQWLKNLLVFVPLLAGHQLGNAELLGRGILAFVLFGLCASSVYILNDLLDVQDDRHHPTKRRRPFAAGQLSLISGLLVAPVLLALAFGGAWFLLPNEFALTLAAYYFLTLGYSLFLKQVMMVDVVTLGLLYTVRIVSGAFAVDLAPTFWLLAFSMFLFLSLALLKRYTELRDARKNGRMGKARGRGYFPGDLEMIASLGAAAGYLSVMVLALYIQDGTTVALYRRPEFIWMSCPLLLFWVSRTWMLAHRGDVHEDPVVFAIKDKVSLAVGGMFALIFWVAR